jgi:hypothetical protein
VVALEVVLDRDLPVALELVLAAVAETERVELVSTRSSSRLIPSASKAGSRFALGAARSFPSRSYVQAW